MRLQKNIIKLFILLLIGMVSESLHAQEARSNKVAYYLNTLPDSIPPSIRIISPVLKKDMSYQSNIELLSLTGEVKDNGRIKFIAINSEKLDITQTGIFTARIELYPGRNEIRLVAADAKNNLKEQFVIIEYDTEE